MVRPSLGADTPLVDVLPAEIGGEPTQRNALAGTDLSAIQPEAAMVFGSLLNVLGSPDADMTIGLASNSVASVIAVRVKDKTAAEVGEAMIAGRALNATTTKEDLELGGKQVIKVDHDHRHRAVLRLRRRRRVVHGRRRRRDARRRGPLEAAVANRPGLVSARSAGRRLQSVRA